MRERKAMESGKPSTDVSVTVLDNTAREGMIVKIRDYLSQNNGRGTSQDIMNNLELNINQEQIVMFRKMLQAIAKFEKDSITGKGVWVLKEDFF
jgi:DNA excision repair protein ERCC-6